MNLLVVLNLLPPRPLFLHLFPILRFLHLLEKFILVGLFILLPLVELSLGNVFKHVAGLHMHDLLLLGRVSGRKHRLAQVALWLRRRRTELLAIRRDLCWGLFLQLILLLERLIFDSAIMLRLA